MQRNLRFLSVARAKAKLPALGVDVVPVAGGALLVVGDHDPERIAEMQAGMVAAEREEADRRDSGRLQLAAGMQASAFRETLAGFSKRRAPAGLVMAGKLLVAHGDAARVELRAQWAPDWPATWARIDELLARAGVPASIQTKVEN